MAGKTGLLIAREIILEDLKRYETMEAVPSYIFSDPVIYDLEMEKIFSKCWLFVGHVSEIPEEGDYVTRVLGNQPVIVARGKDEEIYVLLNVCRHRGMRLCRTDCGNSKHFRCIYHGFTYKNDGTLIGVPFQNDSYGPNLDKSRFGLHKAKVETYKGLIFATWNENPQPLKEYLGHMAWYLDLMVGRAEMEIVGAPQRWTIEANWKLAADNFVSDAYHTGFTHGSVVELGLAAKPQFAKFGYQITAGNGHGLGLGSGVPGSPPILPEECIGEYRKNLTPEQFDTLVNLRNLHANVFPNFSLLIPTVKVEGQMVSVLTLRLWVPSGPNKMEIYSWFMVEKNATEDFKRKSHKGYTLTFGSSGIFEQDDTENWFEITENSRKMLKVVDFFFNAEMGVDRKPVEDGQFPGPGEAIYEGKYNEANSRAFYRQWRKLLLSV